MGKEETVRMKFDGEMVYNGLVVAVVQLATYNPKKIKESGDEDLAELVKKARECIDLLLDFTILKFTPPSSRA